MIDITSILTIFVVVFATTIAVNIIRSRRK